MDPPPFLLSLYQSVETALKGGHVGVPVHVRCIAFTAREPRDLPEALRQMAAVAGSWLGGVPRRVYVQGGAESGQMTAGVQYTRGESALVSVNLTPGDGAPRVELMLLGNTGALYHHGSTLSPAQLAAAGAPRGELPTLPEKLRRAMEESLRTGQAMDVPANGEA